MAYLVLAGCINQLTQSFELEYVNLTKIKPLGKDVFFIEPKFLSRPSSVILTIYYKAYTGFIEKIDVKWGALGAWGRSLDKPNNTVLSNSYEKREGQSIYTVGDQSTVQKRFVVSINGRSISAPLINISPTYRLRPNRESVANAGTISYNFKEFIDRFQLSLDE